MWKILYFNFLSCEHCNVKNIFASLFSVHTIVDRQQTQEDKIKMSKNLLFVEVTSEKLQHILGAHK